MFPREGLGALVDTCWYQCLKNVYDPHMYVSPNYCSIHGPIYAATFSARRWESSMRYFQTAFVRALTTFRRWQGLRHRVVCSSISLMVTNNINMGGGGRVKSGRGGDQDI